LFNKINYFILKQIVSQFLSFNACLNIKAYFDQVRILTVYNKLVSNSVVSKRVLDIARVFSSIASGDFLDEQRSLGQLPHAVVLLENGALDLPLQLRRGHSDSQAGQFDVFLVRGGESVVEGGNLGRNSSTGCQNHRLGLLAFADVGGSGDPELVARLLLQSGRFVAHLEGRHFLALWCGLQG